MALSLCLHLQVPSFAFFKALFLILGLVGWALGFAGFGRHGRTARGSKCTGPHAPSSVKAQLFAGGLPSTWGNTCPPERGKEARGLDMRKLQRMYAGPVKGSWTEGTFTWALCRDSAFLKWEETSRFFPGTPGNM
uniref:Uncharacterized protein n=1 Tax=Marmota marmota marmota TaxID=9994 RepID=A0A8C6EWJ9_MARMA